MVEVVYCWQSGNGVAPYPKMQQSLQDIFSGREYWYVTKCENFDDSAVLYKNDEEKKFGEVWAALVTRCARRGRIASLAGRLGWKPRPPTAAAAVRRILQTDIVDAAARCSAVIWLWAGVRLRP